jgi:AsmA protein
MKKLGITVLVIVVLLVAAALIIPHVININQYHAQIQDQLQKKLGRTVTLGQMSLSLFPPSFQVQNPVIGEDPRFTSNEDRPFASADKLSVSVKFWPLLHKDVQVKSLELVRPHIEMVRNQQGMWNFASLGQPANSPAATEQPPSGNAAQNEPANAAHKKNGKSAKKAKPEPQKTPTPQPQTAGKQPAPEQKSAASEFSLANLQITDGQVAITDQQKHQSRAVYDHIDVTVNDFAPNKPFSLKVAAHLPPDTQNGQQNANAKQIINLEGTGGPIQQADMLNTPFDGKLSLDQVSVAAAQKFLNSQALSGIDALITGDATVKNSGGKLTSDGNIQLANPQIKKVNVGYPITLNYDLTDDLTNDVIQIRKGDLRLGQTPLTIAGTLNTRPTPMQVDLKLTAKNASIEEAARLASAFGVAFGQGMDVKGTVNADIAAKGAADKPAMNGQLSANNLVITSKEIPQPVKVSSLNLALTPDTIKSNDFSATTGSTTVNVNFALSHYTQPNSVIDAALRAPNAKIGELLNIGKAAGISALNDMSGDGLLTLDVHAQGPLKNTSALVFSGTGKVQNATLKMASLTKPIQVRNADLAFSQNSAKLSNLAASVGHTNATGGLTMKNFAAPQVQFTLNADKVDVAELQQLTAPTPAAQPQKRAAVEHDFWSIIPAAQAEAQPRRPASPAQTHMASSEQPTIINKMTGGGTVAIGSVKYNDLLLNNVHSNVTLDRGVVKLNPVTADLYNGKENGNITIDLRPAQPVYTVAMKTEQVDANKLISSVSDVKQTLYGLLNSNVNATFSSTSADAIARSLNGQLALNLTNGRLMNVNMLHELASVGKFLGAAGLPSATQNFTNLVQLSGNFNVKNGVAQTNNLKAVIDGGTMAAAGLVNLANQSLNLHVTAVLNKALSQQVGGTGVGGFMNTALANNQGELVIPVIVTGTFQHPAVAPDVEQLAQMKLKNLLPTSKNPGALTSGILGKILGNKTPGNGQQPQGGLSGILGAIGKQTQQQQQQQQPPNGAVTGNQGQQPQAQPTPTPNPLGDVLGRVLGGKKKASPTPTPQ